MNEPIEIELPLAPFYCFETPSISFVVSNGLIEIANGIPFSPREIPFPTTLHVMDTEANWARAGTIRDLIRNGHAAKAFHRNDDLVLCFGHKRPMCEKENKTSDIMAHKLITMDMSAHVNAFLVLLDAKRIITQAQCVLQPKKPPLSPRSLRRWRHYEQRKKRDSSARNKCLQKMKQLWSNMKQNGFDVKL